MRNDFNPAWIGDLEGRAVKGAEKIMERTLARASHTHGV
jgi:hypothetical protein